MAISASVALKPTLRHRALRAGGWSMAGYGAGLALRVASTVVMTRLLAPEMFGVMAIALTVTMILTLVSDCGLQQNIVQSRRGADPAFLDTAWAVQIVRGFAIWLIATALSAALYFSQGLFAPDSVYAAPVLPAVIAVQALSAVILGFQSTRAATALRSFDQKRLVQIELASQCAAIAAMVLIGAATRSIWALAAGPLVAALVTTLASHAWLDGHANRLRCEREALRGLIAFGKWIFLSSAVYILAAQGDRLLMGGYVDTAVLGLYAIAALIAGVVEGAMHRLFAAVSLPALSEIARSEPQRLREVYYRLRVPSDLLLLFVAGGLAAAGQLVIDVLYDPRYAAAGGMLEVLGLSLVGGRYMAVLQTYLAVGEPRYLSLVNGARFVAIYALVPALYWAGGAQAALWGIALHTLATAPVVYWCNARLGLNDWRREIGVLAALPVGFACGLAVKLACS